MLQCRWQEAYTASGDGTAYVWNGEGKLLGKYRDGGMAKGMSTYCVDVSPDRTTLVTASQDGIARLWQLDGDSDEPSIEFHGHRTRVLRAIFSPDGQCIATASEDGTVRLWNISGEERCVLEHPGPVYGVDFSRDGTFVASACRDGVTRLWCLQSPAPELQGEFRGHKGPVFAVAFSPEGGQLASVSGDGTMQLWALGDKVEKRGELQTKIKAHSGMVFSVAYEPNGSWLTTAAWDGTVHLWNRQGRRLAQFKQHDNWILKVAINKNRLATASGDGTAKVRWIVKEDELEFLLDRGDSWLANYRSIPDQ